MRSIVGRPLQPDRLRVGRALGDWLESQLQASLSADWSDPIQPSEAAEFRITLTDLVRSLGRSLGLEEALVAVHMWGPAVARAVAQSWDVLLSDAPARAEQIAGGSAPTRSCDASTGVRRALAWSSAHPGPTEASAALIVGVLAGRPAALVQIAAEWGSSVLCSEQNQQISPLDDAVAPSSSVAALATEPSAGSEDFCENAAMVAGDECRAQWVGLDASTWLKALESAQLETSTVLARLQSSIRSRVSEPIGGVGGGQASRGLSAGQANKMEAVLRKVARQADRGYDSLMGLLSARSQARAKPLDPVLGDTPAESVRTFGCEGVPPLAAHAAPHPSTVFQMVATSLNDLPNPAAAEIALGLASAVPEAAIAAGSSSPPRLHPFTVYKAGRQIVTLPGSFARTRYIIARTLPQCQDLSREATATSRRALETQQGAPPQLADGTLWEGSGLPQAIEPGSSQDVASRLDMVDLHGLHALVRAATTQMDMPAAQAVVEAAAAQYHRESKPEPAIPRHESPEAESAEAANSSLPPWHHKTLAMRLSGSDADRAKYQFGGWEVCDLAVLLMKDMMPANMSTRDMVTAMQSVHDELLPALGVQPDWRVISQAKRALIGDRDSVSSVEAVTVLRETVNRFAEQRGWDYGRSNRAAANVRKLSVGLARMPGATPEYQDVVQHALQMYIHGRQARIAKPTWMLPLPRNGWEPWPSGLRAIGAVAGHGGSVLDPWTELLRLRAAAAAQGESAAELPANGGPREGGTEIRARAAAPHAWLQACVPMAVRQLRFDAAWPWLPAVDVSKQFVDPACNDRSEFAARHS